MPVQPSEMGLCEVPVRAEGTTKGHENAEGMALGCVRVDLTVRLGRGVEGLCITTT